MMMETASSDSAQPCPAAYSTDKDAPAPLCSSAQTPQLQAVTVSGAAAVSPTAACLPDQCSVTVTFNSPHKLSCGASTPNLFVCSPRCSSNHTTNQDVSTTLCPSKGSSHGSSSWCAGDAEQGSAQDSMELQARQLGATAQTHMCHTVKSTAAVARSARLEVGPHAGAEAALLQQEPFLALQQAQHARLARTHSVSASSGFIMHHANSNTEALQGGAEQQLLSGMPCSMPSTTWQPSHVQDALSAAEEVELEDTHDMDTIRAASKAQATAARAKLLQEIEQQRELQHTQLLRRNMLRWRINHAAYKANKFFKQLVHHMLPAQLPADTQLQQVDGGWGRTNGEAESVIADVEERLHSAQARLVPSAIAQQQQVRNLLKDRNRGVVSTLLSYWQDFRLARRLRKLASNSSAAAAVSAIEANRKPNFHDPLVQGVRTQEAQAMWQSGKLPDWIVGLKPGCDRGWDQFWLQRQWQVPPFSTALADAEELRQRREGAVWCGGPQTESGLLAFEELQLRHMLAEQSAALRRVRLRRLLSVLPGKGHLKAVPLTCVLGSCGVQSAYSAGVEVATSAAAYALQSNIKDLKLLLKYGKTAAAVAPAVSAVPPPARHAIDRGNAHKSCGSKRRMLPDELTLLCRQHQLQLMWDTLPAVEEAQLYEFFLREWDLPTGWEKQTTTALAVKKRQPASHGVAGRRIQADNAEAMTAASRVQDSDFFGWECLSLGREQLKRHGMLNGVVRALEQTHERDLQRLQQLARLAEAGGSKAGYAQSAAEEQTVASEQLQPRTQHCSVTLLAPRPSLEDNQQLLQEQQQGLQPDIQHGQPLQPQQQPREQQVQQPHEQPTPATHLPDQAAEPPGGSSKQATDPTPPQAAVPLAAAVHPSKYATTPAQQRTSGLHRGLQQPGRLSMQDQQEQDRQHEQQLQGLSLQSTKKDPRPLKVQQQPARGLQQLHRGQQQSAAKTTVQETHAGKQGELQRHAPQYRAHDNITDVAAAGDDWLSKYAHRIRGHQDKSATLHARKRQLEALSKLYLGTPIWEDAAAIGPMQVEALDLYMACLRTHSGD